jgi:hypothetical protein
MTPTADQLAILEKKQSDLKNLLRVLDNTCKLLSDGVYPGSACLALAESINWLQTAKKDIETQLRTIDGISEAVKTPEVVS